MILKKNTDLKLNLIKKARELGFDDIRISKPQLPSHVTKNYSEFIQKGLHGEMNWLESRAEYRLNSELLMKDVRSIIMLAINYTPKKNPIDLVGDKERAYISVYAHGIDYHIFIKKKLKKLASWLQLNGGGNVKVFLDTAPVLEKPFAQNAGLGWQGKHTNLVSKKFGSWTFLGEIFSSIDFEADQPEEDHCGSCIRCMDICPTKAFIAPYKIDARKCISYLTIEYKGHIPLKFRKLIGNRIYGCDDCLAVCPWNKFAINPKDDPMSIREELEEMKLIDLVSFDDKYFREFFSKSPIKRIGRDRFIRNVLIAIGNSGKINLVDNILLLLSDTSDLVRAMSVWALGELDMSKAKKLKAHYVKKEKDNHVLSEWMTIK